MIFFIRKVCLPKDGGVQGLVHTGLNGTKGAPHRFRYNQDLDNVIYSELGMQGYPTMSLNKINTPPIEA